MGFVLQVHSFWQYAILIFTGLVALKAVLGWLGKQPYTALDDRLSLALTIALDLQFALGLLLWLFGPINFRQLSSAMGNEGLRFYLLEHNVIYLIALVLAHIGRSRAKKAGAGVSKHRASALFFLLSFVFILAIIIMK